MSVWSSTHIVICGTVRYCEKYLDSVFNNIKLLTSLFADYQIIIAVDLSEDLSLAKLANKKREHGDKMKIVINREPLSNIRTERISNARNVCLKQMREDIASNRDERESEYFIVMDMDDVCAVPINIDVFKRTMDRSDNWDCVSFNRKSYYDIWALSIDKYIYSCWGWFSPQEVVDHTREYIEDKLSKIPADQFAECRSAFNGFAIYRKSKFLDCYYDWRMPKQYMNLDELLEQQKMLWGVGSRSPLEIQTDEPDCEHRAFHMMAEAKNGARIRISPEILF